MYGARLSHPPMPIRFLLHVFLLDILQRRLKTTRTRLRRSRKRVIHTDAISRDADVVDVNLSPAVPFTMPRLRRENLFFSPF